MLYQTDAWSLPTERLGSALIHVHSSYISSSNNCSAFNKRTIIIKIAIVKKVIYIINFLWVYYSGIFCTWSRTKFPMYTETWGGVGGAATLAVLALCPERQGSFLRSRLARHPAVLKQRHSVNLVGLGRGLGIEEWGHFLLSPPTVCLFVRPVRQQLLFLNSPFSVMESLVGLVGEMPFRTCMLYRSFTWVSALISLVLAESSDMIRFSYNTPNRALFWLHVGNCAVTLYQMTVLMLSIKQQCT